MKTYIGNKRDELQKEFYQMYDPDYWLYKIMLLKNSHDNFDSLKDTFTKNIEDPASEDFKRVIRTELHFLYFQMIETLFEIIFAVYENDNRDLWVSLTFSDFMGNYQRISKLDDYSDIFIQKIKTEIDGQEREIPMLRWVFYFVYTLNVSEEEWVKNLGNIKKVLLMCAKDFSDRGEYNAYKHSLRFYNSPFSLSLGIDGTGVMQELGTANDCITFLEERKKKDVHGNLQPTGRIMKTKKPFDFEKDYNSCLAIYSMIKTIVYTRKYSLLKECNGKNFDLLNFTNLDSIKISFSGGVYKTSFTV